MNSPNEQPRRRAFNGRFKTPRSRAGCSQCRQRRVKCDEQKPSCIRCMNGNLCCVYQVALSWPGEPRLSKPRGVKASSGSPSPARRTSSTVGSSPETMTRSSREEIVARWLNPVVDALLPNVDAVSVSDSTVTDDIYVALNDDLQDAEPADGQYPSWDVVPELLDSSLSILRPSTMYPDGSSTGPFAKQLFDFYLHRMCLKCILLDKNSHSYRKVVVPIALQSNLVFNALLALAASQMLPYQDDSTSKQKTLQYQGYSLRTLAHRISSVESGRTSGSEIIAAILMLCLLEVMHNSFQRGVSDSIDVDVHAFGAQRVLESPTFDASKAHNIEMSSFLGQMLSARYLLQFTAKSAAMGDAEAEGRARYWMSKTTRPAQEVNCFAGCSNELLALLCDIISAIRQHVLVPFDEGSLCVLRASLEERLGQIQQQELLRQDESSCAGQISWEANRFLVIAEAYRYVAMILIERYLRQNANHEVIEAHLRAVLSEPYMSSAFAIPPPGKVSRCSPLWPIFIASCHVDDPPQREEVASYFSYVGTRDDPSRDVLDPMLAVIEGVWARQDAGALGQFGDGVWRFPWEEVLVSKGWELCWA